MALDQIHLFQADHAFLTVGTVSSTEGMMDYRVEAAHVIKAMTQQARHTTILADRSKLEKTALVRTCDLDQAHRLVTDSIPPDSLIQALDAAGTRLHIANSIE